MPAEVLIDEENASLRKLVPLLARLVDRLSQEAFAREE